MSEDRLPMHIGVLSAEFHFPDSESLKQKRMLLKSLKDRLRNQFNVSITELDGHDKWQWTVLGVCMIGTDKPHIDASLQAVQRMLESQSEMRLGRTQLDFV